MKVVVDFDLCCNHGLCVDAAPEVFDLKDGGLVVLDAAPPDSLRAKVDKAVRECPTAAIAVED